MKLPKRIKSILIKFDALKQQVDELQKVVKKIELKNNLLSKENAIQSLVIQQTSKLLSSKPAYMRCDQNHLFCAIEHNRFNRVKPTGNLTVDPIAEKNVPSNRDALEKTNHLEVNSGAFLEKINRLQIDSLKRNAGQLVSNEPSAEAISPADADKKETNDDESSNDAMNRSATSLENSYKLERVNDNVVWAKADDYLSNDDSASTDSSNAGKIEITDANFEDLINNGTINLTDLRIAYELDMGRLSLEDVGIYDKSSHKE